MRSASSPTGGSSSRRRAPPAWRAIEDAIRADDPWCRGVVLLGLEAPEDELDAAFALAAAKPGREGLRRRPHDLRRGGGEMACRIDAGRGGGRRDGGAVREAVPGVGPGGGRCEEGCMRGWRTPSPRLRGEADSAGGRAGEGLSTVEPSRRHPLTFALRARLAADEGCEALSPQAGRGKAPAIRD